MSNFSVQTKKINKKKTRKNVIYVKSVNILFYSAEKPKHKKKVVLFVIFRDIVANPMGFKYSK